MQTKTILLVSLLVFALGGFASAEQIRLKTGDYLQGEVIGDKTDENRVTVKLYRTGGVFELPWDKVIPEDEKRIKEGLGLIEVDIAAIPMIDGHEVTFVDGSVALGVVLNPEATSGPVRLKTAGGVLDYSRDRVASVKETLVDALTAYTPEELAGKIQEEMQPETPASWVEYGDLCYQATAYSMALTAYQTALEDPDYAESIPATAIKNKMKRLEILVKAKDAVTRLRDVKRLVHQHRYQQAIDLVNSLKEEYAESEAILNELKLDNVLKTVMKQRRKYFLGQVRRSFYKLLEKIVNKKVRERIYDEDDAKERDISIREVKQWIQNPKGLTFEIFSTIATQEGISEMEARSFWDDRTSKQVRRYNYGTATFIHPEEVDKRAKAEDDKKKQRQQRSSRRKQQPRRRTSTQQQKPKSEDDWWKNANSKARQNFVKAWYAELGPAVFKVLRVEKRPCPTCGGQGTLAAPDPNSDEPVRKICPTCNKSGHFRIVICR